MLGGKYQADKGCAKADNTNGCPATVVSTANAPEASKTKKSKGEVCDIAAAEDKNMGCVVEHRCAKPAAVTSTDATKLAAETHKCVPATECGVEATVKEVKVTWVCSATKVVASVVSALAISFAM